MCNRKHQLLSHSLYIMLANLVMQALGTILVRSGKPHLYGTIIAVMSNCVLSPP